MATSMALASKLTSMLLMVLLGFLAVKLRIITPQDSKALSALVVYVLQPALIIHAFRIDLTPERLWGFLFGAAVSICIFILWIALSFLLKKPLHLSPVDQTTLVYSNAGNLTLPVVSMVLGEEMVFYVSALQIPFNLFIWTHGESVISGTNGINVKKLIKNSNLISLFIGLILLLARIQLPDTIETTISALSGAVAPLSMIVVGMVIAESRLGEILSRKRAYLIVLGRLVFFPMIAMLLLFATGILARHRAFVPVMQAIFMGLFAPPASTVSQLSVLYDEHPVDATTYNTIGMFLCVLTIPLMNLVYTRLFPIV